jgi:hypothetical protein
MGFDLSKLRVQVFPDRWDRPLGAWQAAGNRTSDRAKVAVIRRCELRRK